MLDSLVRVSRREKENHFASLSRQDCRHAQTNFLDALPVCVNQTWLWWPQRPNRKQSGKYDAPGTGFLRFHFSNFRYSLTLFSKFFASFPHGTCTLSVSHQYLALDGIYHPIRAAIPNNSTRRLLAHEARRTGVSPSQLPHSKGLGPAANASVFRPQFSARAQISHGLFPLQSPLLGEFWLVSFPPLNYMLKFSGCSYLS